MSAGLRQLAEAATPGPWRVQSDGREFPYINAGDYDEVLAPAPVACIAYCYGGSSRVDLTNADAAFIAAANPQAVLALLDERDALAARVAAVEALCADFPGGGADGLPHDGFDRGWNAASGHWRADLRAATGAADAAGSDDSDPADYGYSDLPKGRNGVRITPGPPEGVICRTCERPATDHTAGRFSIYGVCPTSAALGAAGDDQRNGPANGAVGPGGTRPAGSEQFNTVPTPEGWRDRCLCTSDTTVYTHPRCPEHGAAGDGDRA